MAQFHEDLFPPHLWVCDSIFSSTWCRTSGGRELNTLAALADEARLPLLRTARGAID